MKRIFSIVLCFLLLSCNNNEKHILKLEKDLKQLEDLLFLVENKYKTDFIEGKNIERIIFADCEELGYKTVNCIDDVEIKNKMLDLEISEIKFEKIESKCNGRNGFTEVYFKLYRGNFDDTSYYLYEYCGTNDNYDSSTIVYQPLNRNWSVYTEKN